MLRRTFAHGKSFDATMLRKLNRMLDLVEDAYKAMIFNLKAGYKNLTNISNASDAEYNINGYRNSLREEHIINIEKENYQYQTGVFYMDIVNELERIGDFIINVSEALIGENED